MKESLPNHKMPKASRGLRFHRATAPAAAPSTNSQETTSSPIPALSPQRYELMNSIRPIGNNHIRKCFIRNQGADKNNCQAVMSSESPGLLPAKELAGLESCRRSR